jgi:putative FmdB family regulatory protein
MPTYEYACTSCANEWEFEQSIKDEPIKKCPKCHKQTARRQISRGTGFILKGSGWYSDLYSSSSNKKESKVETTTPSTSSESKADTKPASTSEAKPKADSGSSSGGGDKPDKPKAKSEPSAAA